MGSQQRVVVDFKETLLHGLWHNDLESFVRRAYKESVIIDLYHRLQNSALLCSFSLQLIFSAERIVQCRLKEDFDSNRFKVYGGWIGFVQSCEMFVNFVVFDVDEVNFIWWSIELELKVCIVEEKNGSVAAVTVRNVS